MSKPKINLIIFSKDRACQLDLLLRSIARFHLTDCFDVKVLYTFSHKKFDEGYEKCFEDWDFVEPFVQRLPFGSAANQLLASPNKYTCFSTDDMVFYREPEVDILQALDTQQFTKNCVFSLRLGYNTRVQDCHAHTYQPALNLHYAKNGILRWNPTNYVRNTNYGYPLAIDLHIYHANFIRGLLSRFKWNNTNDMEGGLQKFSHEVSELWALPASIAVNIPANNLSGLTRSGERYPYSVEELNTEYLKGKRLDHMINPDEVVGCHQEIELKLI